MNSGIWWLIILLLLPLLAVRWLRWLAIVQQKEYRIDRLIAFLKSEEGQQDLLRLIPHPRDFTRTGLKRPVKTFRVMMIAGISGLFIICLLPGNLQNLPVLAETLLFLYFLLPFVLFLSCTPTALVAYFMTIRALKIACQKLEAGHAKIIGIGGSYGKTSTKYLIEHLLSSKYTVFTTPKSHNTKYSVAQSIIAGYTNQQIALLEYGAYRRGEISYLTTWFAPTMAVETGFTLQHLGLFGSVEKSLAAESELVAALPLGEKVFCNAADEGAAKICELGRVENKAEVIPYTGLNTVVALDNNKLNDQAELSFSWRGHLIHTRIVGKHYLPNIQAAVAVALELGVTEELIVTALESFQPNDSFMQSRVLHTGAVCIDDGDTSNPRGFTAAIELVRDLPETHKVLLTAGIVDLGRETDHIHQRLAAEAKRVFQTVVYVGVDGHSQFEAEFGEQLITDKDKIVQLVQSAAVGTAILIEGHVPSWLEEILK